MPALLIEIKPDSKFKDPEAFLRELQNEFPDYRIVNGDTPRRSSPVQEFNRSLSFEEAVPNAPEAIDSAMAGT